MEQRLDATYLRCGPFERAAAVGFCALAIGGGILLAAWGTSLLWKYSPPEITITQRTPFKVEQDKPFKVEQDKPFKVEQDNPSIVPPPSNSDRKETNAIKREVTVFWLVTHGLGEVVTGWKYADGRGGNPVHQYCYYSAPNADHSSRRVDIASNRIPSPNIDGGLVPDLEGALAKCQWGQG
jgi:hypothetical protein